MLERAIADARSGRPRLAWISGEPGAGKTTVAMQATRGPSAAGARVAVCRAWEGGGVPAFWLWRECLRELGDESALPTAIVGDEARFAALETIAARVRAASRSSPVVLVLDDLQWADVPSLLALKLLVRSMQSERIAVLATIREPDEAAPETAAVLSGIRREAVVVPIPGLERDDIAVLARSRGLESTVAIDAITRATNGNALFAVELMEDRDARRALAGGSPLPAPRGVRDVLDRHLARLGREDRDVVAWAAASGDPIDVATIAAAAGVEHARVAAALETACREGVLARAGDAPRFAHDLFRTAAYDAIPHERRAAMHGALAGALAGAARLRHLFAADPASSDPSVAREALGEARAAIARLGYEEAAELAEKAARVFERAHCPDEHAMARATVAEARTLGGDPERGAADAERALAIAREAGGAVSLARAALAVGLRRTLGVADRSLAGALEEALARLDAEGVADEALRCAVEARLAAALQPAIDPPRAVETARRAIRRARATGDPRTIARTIHEARPAFRLLEPLDERVAMDRELAALADRLGDAPLSAHAETRSFWSSLESGDAATADAALETLEARAEALRLPHHELAARLARCAREAMQGHFDRAEAVLAEIERSRDRWRPAIAAVFPLDPTMLMRLMLATARRVPVALDMVSGPSVALGLLQAYVDARSGRIAEAAAAIPALAERWLAGEVSYMARAMLGDVLARAGDATRAQPMYELCLPFAGRHVVLTPLPGYDGAFDRLLGALANVRGDRAGALRHYDAAIAMEESLGALAYAERSRLERGDIAPARAQVPVMVGRALGPRFLREGETWLVTFGDESARLKDADGLRYLAYLVERPDVPVPVVELFAERATARGETAPPAGDAGPMLDRQAIAAYRERARDLRETLAEAEAKSDLGVAEAARRELEALEEELASAVGLGGRPRRAASDAERIRVNVTTRIRKVIARLAELAPRLGRHLEASIRTGATCTYQPP